ncbi:hypothetical protein MG293_001145 [Ovis ammon polii]|uniref:G-protein coupled receptors family 1 profile domain-containing protein n=1 Tax=Ovis ammon polii TaxID=230172 RepID=A0AAD4YFD3_OVIAM|nr:hypothetical protein MG293_001145 [Ovis ammon polii]
MYFFLGFAVTNCLLLGVMGYDRYAAICQPLHYPILMSWRVCGQLAVTCIVSGFLISLLGTTLVFSLPFCGSNKVNHYFCDISPVIRLAYAETYINELVIFIGGVLVLVVPLIFIFISYGFIASAILKISSAEGKRKAFSTCASHLIVVVVHYGCASFVYLRPSAKYTSGKDRLVTVTYTIITPLLNPVFFELPFCPNKINHYFCDICLACTDSYINDLIIFIGGVLALMVPMTFICISYGFIVHAILRIPSVEGKRKAFSTCASHLAVVIVHYGCASFVYLRLSSKYSSSKDRLVTVTYTVVTPLLNPLVSSLRNKDVQMAIQIVIGGRGFYSEAL